MRGRNKSPGSEVIIHLQVLSTLPLAPAAVGESGTEGTGVGVRERIGVNYEMCFSQDGDIEVI